MGHKIRLSLVSGYKTHRDEGCSPSGYCSQKESSHPRVVSRRRSDVVDREGFYVEGQDTAWWGGITGENAPLLVLNLRFNIVNCIGRLHLEGDSLSCEGLYEDLHGDG